MVLVAYRMCGLCGKTHTSESVSVVYRHSQLNTVCDGKDGVGCRITEI